MTRGNLVRIFCDKNGEERIQCSLEFNGDMMFDGGLGVPAMRALMAAITDKMSFETIVSFFNSHHHKYDDEKIVYEFARYEDSDDMLDMTHDFFEKWGSDYLYILNDSDKDIEIICKPRERSKKSTDTVKISPKDMIVLNYGSFFAYAFINNDDLYAKNTGKSVTFLGKAITNASSVWKIPDEVKFRRSMLPIIKVHENAFDEAHFLTAVELYDKTKCDYIPAGIDVTFYD